MCLACVPALPLTQVFIPVLHEHIVIMLIMLAGQPQARREEHPLPGCFPFLEQLLVWARRQSVRRPRGREVCAEVPIYRAARTTCFIGEEVTVAKAGQRDFLLNSMVSLFILHILSPLCCLERTFKPTGFSFWFGLCSLSVMLIIQKIMDRDTVIDIDKDTNILICRWHKHNGHLMVKDNVA